MRSPTNPERHAIEWYCRIVWPLKQCLVNVDLDMIELERQQVSQVVDTLRLEYSQLQTQLSSHNTRKRELDAELAAAKERHRAAVRALDVELDKAKSAHREAVESLETPADREARVKITEVSQKLAYARQQLATINSQKGEIKKANPEAPRAAAKLAKLDAKIVAEAEKLFEECGAPHEWPEFMRPKQWEELPTTPKPAVVSQDSTGE